MQRLFVVVATLFVFASFPVSTTAQNSTPTGTQTNLDGAQPLPFDAGRQATFESYASDILAKTHVPGASVAVVQGGEIVYLHGFGLRSLSEGTPVTPDTLMMIGSVNKSMTTMLAATLVDDGDLSWDTPLVDLVPSFAVADPELTKRLTVRDAFCMCTGLPERDLELVFNSAELTPEKVIASVRDFPITAPLGEEFHYSNQMFAIGGYAATVAAGGTPGNLSNAYAVAMRERVLDPLGMNQSTFSLDEAQARGDYATAYGPNLAGAYEPVPLTQEESFVSPVAPAGALWSDAREMALYLEAELAGGIAADGTQVVSGKNLEKTWEQQVAFPTDPNAPPEVMDYLQGRGYGLGWFLRNYYGQPLLTHGGGTLGFTSMLTALPEADLGIVTLTNAAYADTFALAVQTRLLELVFDQEPTWDQVASGDIDAMAQFYAELERNLGRVDVAAIAPYVGQYVNDALGEVTVALEGGKLIFDVGEIRSELLPQVGEEGTETAYVVYDPPLAGAIAVAFSLDGGNPVLKVIDLSFEDEYEFTFTGAGANLAD